MSNFAKLDSNLTMDNHTKSVSKCCFYHIRSLRHIRSSLDDDMAVSVPSAIVSSRLDYVNSILLGCPQKHIAGPEFVRAVVQPQSCALPLSSSSHLLKQLHWLPVDWWIRFKLSTLTFKALHRGRPKYLTNLLHLHKPGQTDRQTHRITDADDRYTDATVGVSNRSMRSPYRAYTIHSTISTSTLQPFLWLTRFPYFCTEKLEHFTT